MKIIRYNSQVSGLGHWVFGDAANQDRIQEKVWVEEEGGSYSFRHYECEEPTGHQRVSFQYVFGST